MELVEIKNVNELPNDTADFLWFRAGDDIEAKLADLNIEAATGYQLKSQVWVPIETAS